MIQHGQYIAYVDRGAPKSLYSQSYNYLTKASSNKPTKLDDLIAAIKPIYDDHSLVTTEATNYYSPLVHYDKLRKVIFIEPAPPTSNFQKEISSGVMQPVTVPGLVPYNPETRSSDFDNFRFYKRNAVKGKPS